MSAHNRTQNVIDDSLFSHRGQLSQSTLDTLSITLAGNEAVRALLEKNWGLDDLDAPAAVMILEPSFSSGSLP